MEITLIDETNKLPEEKIAQIEELLQFAANQLSLPTNTEMSVTFMSNSHIQAINRDYRKKDQPTDVISFALEETVADDFPIQFDEEIFADMPRNIGDIMISIDKAEEQAEEYGHSFERELGFLAVHGFLHLNGYDHMEAADEKEMFGLQEEILNAYGLTR